MKTLAEKYPQDVQAIFEKYPDDEQGRRSAVMPLLYLAQRDKMYVSKTDIDEIGVLCGISATDVASIIGFYTLYYDEEFRGGKIRIQVCNDLPCALRGADEFLEQLSTALGIRPGETTPDGLVTLEAVMCLAACDKAPMFQSQTGEGLKYHENQTVESALGIIDTLRKGVSRKNGHE